MADAADLDRLIAAGAAAFGAGRLEDAAASFDAARRLQPAHAGAAANLALVRFRQQRFEEAAGLYVEALARAPGRPAFALALSATLQKLNRVDAAVEVLDRAIAQVPADADLLAARGAALFAAQRHGAAEDAFRSALALRPGDAALANNLAGTLRLLGRLSEAAMFYRQALSGDPDSAEIQANLASLLRDTGRPEEAVALLRKLVEGGGATPEIHSSLIFSLDFLMDFRVAEHQAERQAWQARHAAPLRDERQPHHNPPVPDRKLRVGYVSADFMVHSASALFGPIILGHDRERFDVTCYSSTAGEDFRSAMFAAVTRFERVAHLDDAALAQRIRADGIDILVDLSGHTAGNRLLAFARKPAPVQVTAWGHATGTGLEAMDYFFADPFLVPAAERHLYAEEIADLPCLLCYEAPYYAPEVAPLPADANGHVTFGCLNRLAKVSAEVMEVWAEILRGISGSRLLLKGNGMEDDGIRARFLDGMAAGGIGPERLILQGRTSRSAHLAAHGEIDIALDPFPHCGGTSTCEALWMGVPVVSLAGRPPSSRTGLAILSAIGFPGLATGDRAGYVALACGLAANRDLLRRLRLMLRPQFAASPVGDTAGYTRAVEAAYREIWRSWCTSRGSTGPAIITPATGDPATGDPDTGDPDTINLDRLRGRS